MRKRLTNLIVSGLFVALGVLGVAGLATQPVYAEGDCAANPNSPACQARKGLNATGTQNNSCGPNGTDECTLGGVVKTVINVLLFIIGSLSVIMIIIGGIRYVISNGDSSQVTSAKNTIMYAVIGLIVALLAYAIVNFVVTQFT